MDAKKLQFDVSSGLESHFDFLPDELLLCIFNKMVDLINLFLCSLVSKRFASVISQIRAVSITLPQIEAYSHESHKSAITLFKEVRGLTGDELHRFLEQYFHKLKLPILIQKFPELESIYVEYTCPRNEDDDNSSLFKWKVDCGSHTTKIENFVGMLPVSVHKRSEFVPGQELMTLEKYADFFGSRIGECIWSFYECYGEWLFLIYALATCHATLRSVTVTDSRKKGKLVMSDERLFNFRSDHTIKEVNFQPNLKAAWVPELHLPVSGYVMRGVCLVAVKSLNESDTFGEGDDVFTWDYEEEEKVFGEAIKEVFKNHSDKIIPAV